MNSCGWPQLEAESAALVRAAKGADRSDDLFRIATSRERRETEAEQWLRGASPKASGKIQ
jgi:hypothetical protein